MSGIAIAELIKWPALVVGGLAVIFGAAYMVRRRIARGAVAEDDLEEAAAAEEERKDATQEIKSKTARLRAALRRARG